MEKIEWHEHRALTGKRYPGRDKTYVQELLDRLTKEGHTIVSTHATGAYIGVVSYTKAE